MQYSQPLLCDLSNMSEDLYDKSLAQEIRALILAQRQNRSYHDLNAIVGRRPQTKAALEKYFVLYRSPFRDRLEKYYAGLAEENPILSNNVKDLSNLYDSRPDLAQTMHMLYSASKYGRNIKQDVINFFAKYNRAKYQSNPTEWEKRFDDMYVYYYPESPRVVRANLRKYLPFNWHGFGATAAKLGSLGLGVAGGYGLYRHHVSALQKQFPSDDADYNFLNTPKSKTRSKTKTKTRPKTKTKSKTKSKSKAKAKSRSTGAHQRR